MPSLPPRATISVTIAAERSRLLPPRTPLPSPQRGPEALRQGRADRTGAGRTVLGWAVGVGPGWQERARLGCRSREGRAGALLLPLLFKSAARPNGRGAAAPEAAAALPPPGGGCCWGAARWEPGPVREPRRCVWSGTGPGYTRPVELGQPGWGAEAGTRKRGSWRAKDAHGWGEVTRTHAARLS